MKDKTIDEKDLKNEVMLTASNIVIVCDKNSFIIAGQYAIEIRQKIKEVVEWFKPMKDAANKTLQEIREKSVLDPLEKADMYNKNQMNQYLMEQKRIEEELQFQAEREALLVAQKERERLQEEAKQAALEGRDDAVDLLNRAESVYAEPVNISPLMDKTTKIETGSVTGRKDIKITVVDIQALCKEIAEGKVPATVVDIKLANLKSFCKLNQVKGNQIKGIIVEEIVGASIKNK